MPLIDNNRPLRFRDAFGESGDYDELAGRPKFAV